MEEDKNKTPDSGMDKTSETSESTRKPSGKSNNRWLMIGIGAGAVIILVILLFARGPLSLGGKVAIKVGSENILESQIDKEYTAYSKQYEQANKKKPDKKMKKEIQKLIAERLVQQELIKVAAEKEGVKVTDKELKERIDQIKKSTSKEQLDKTLKQMNWTMEDLENMVENQILATKVREKVTKGLKTSDKDAEKYYKDNKKNYLVPDTVSAKIATFKKQKEADDFLASVKGGKKFDDAVKKYIKGGVTAQQLSKDQITGIYGKKLADETFALEKGGVSSVVKTKNGTYVTTIDKKEKGKQKTYKEVKEEIKSMLASQKQMEKFNTYLEALKKKTKVEYVNKELKTKASSRPSGHPQ